MFLKAANFVFLIKFRRLHKTVSFHLQHASVVGVVVVTTMLLLIQSTLTYNFLLSSYYIIGTEVGMEES